MAREKLRQNMDEAKRWWRATREGQRSPIFGRPHRNEPPQQSDQPDIVIRHQESDETDVHYDR